MKTTYKLLLAVSAISLSSLSFANEALPKHNGKCGDLQGSNMGDKMEQCRVGDVVIVQRKVVPMYCDYRYSIHRYEGSGVTGTFSCVLRVLRKDRHKK